MKSVLLSSCLAQEEKRAQLEWLDKEVTARYDPLTGRTADGAWREITALFNAQFGTQKKLEALTNWYNENIRTVNDATTTKGLLTAGELAWLVQAVDRRLAGAGTMPPGGWIRIADEFKQQFGIAKTVRNLQHAYKSARS